MKPIIVLGVFILLSGVLTWPLIPQWTNAFWGLGGDGYACVWGSWIRRSGLVSEGVNPLVCAPFGVVVSQPLQPVYDFLFLFFSRVCGNDVQGYNLFAFLSFPLTSFASYCLFLKIHKDHLAAFYGGLVFGFCPASVIHSLTGHIGFSFNVFIPLLFLVCFLNREKRTFGGAVLMGAVYSLLTLTCLYWGYFILFALLGFVVWDFLTGCPQGQKKHFFLNYGISAVTFLLVFIPFEFSAIREHLLASRSYLEAIGHFRPLVHLATLSARPWEYIIPSCNHPLVGKWVESFFRPYLHGSNFPEQTLFLGFVPLSLVALGFVLRRKGLKIAFTPYFLLFVLLALLMVILSAPPYIPLGELKLPLISNFLYKLVPMFRGYNRFGILAVFFLAGASSVVIASLRHLVSNRIYLSVVVIACLSTIIEFGIAPQRRSLSPVDNVPDVVQWLAKKPKGMLIVEYPMMMPEDAAFLQYLFWQRIHQQRLVNGALPNNQRSWDLYQKIKNFSSSEVPGLLKDLGVDYVVLHGGLYGEGPVPYSLKPWYPPHLAELEYNDGVVPFNHLFGPPVQTFGSDQVFVPLKQSQY